MRIRKLAVKNWKNFVQAEVPIRDRVFLVGPNAAGKSNLLDIFRFFRDLASIGGGFQEAIDRRGGVSAIRCLAARRYSDVELAVTLESTASDARVSTWEYEVAFYQDNQRRPLVRKETVRCDGETKLSRPGDQDQSDPQQLTQTHLEQVNVNKPFRELAMFFCFHSLSASGASTRSRTGPIGWPRKRSLRWRLPRTGCHDARKESKSPAAAHPTSPASGRTTIGGG